MSLNFFSLSQISFSSSSLFMVSHNCTFMIISIRQILLSLNLFTFQKENKRKREKRRMNLLVTIAIEIKITKKITRRKFKI